MKSVARQRTVRPTPAEVAATIYKGLGIDLEAELPGAQGRPIPLVDRGVEPISELFAIGVVSRTCWLRSASVHR